MMDSAFVERGVFTTAAAGRGGLICGIRVSAPSSQTIPRCRRLLRSSPPPAFRSNRLLLFQGLIFIEQHKREATWNQG